MWDLLLGLLVILAGSAGLFCLGVVVARRRSGRLSLAAGIAAAVFILLFGLFVHGTLLVAQIVPFSNAIVLGNWIPPGAALLAGIAAGQRALPLWRRGGLALLLLAMAWSTVLCHFVGRCRPSPHSWFVGDVAIQSRAVTCGPCCAVTLLRQCGIESSEREMIDLCLTTTRGTPCLGIFRGLKIKTAGTEWDVEVVRGTMEELCRSDRWPVLLRVRLDAPGPRGEPGHCFSWPARQNHTLVMFGVTDQGLAVVADPASPTVNRWCRSLDNLTDCWYGEGLRLVKRERRMAPPNTSNGASRNDGPDARSSW